MFNVSTESIGAAHLEAVRKVCKLGVPDITEDGEHVVKLNEPLCIHVSNPLHDYSKFINSPYGVKFDEIYEGKVIGITPMNHDGLDPVYTYGNRIRDYPRPVEAPQKRTHPDELPVYGIFGDGDIRQLQHYGGYDQLDACLKKFADNPNTRRAAMSTWVPYKDHESHDPPCIMVIHLEVVEGKLTLVAFIRSNDILMAWGENAIGLTAVLHHAVRQLGYQVGYLETISRNAHVYFKRDQTDLRSMGIMYDI